MMRASMIIGVDIGGTKVAAGLVDSAGEITHKTRVPMIPARDAATGFAAVVNAVEAVFASAPEARAAVTGIGLCAPGPLDPKTGVVLNPPNVPCWRGFPLAAETQRVFGVPAKVDNDANAAGLAEYLWGAGKGCADLFYGTLGTGVGAGIILNGRIHHGRTGSAAEGGHVTIDYRGPRCACGKYGCIEALAAGPAIAMRAQAKGASRMSELAGTLDQVRAEHVGQAFAEGDPIARQVLEETAFLLTVWLGNVVDLLEPDTIVIGGGMAKMMQPFFADISKNLPKWSINQRSNEIAIVLARYGADAGIAGAAALVG
jgi:glucokinase